MGLLTKEAWTAQTREETPAIVHMMEMRERPQDMADVVKEAAEKAHSHQKSHYDQHAKKRALSPGDKALVLLLSSANKLKLEWAGPYQVLRQLNDVDYEVETPGRRREKKIFHINLLKKWNDYQTALLATVEGETEQTWEASDICESPREGEDWEDPL